MLQDATIALTDELGSKAEYLYRSRKHLCADAILLTFNEALGGGLTEQQVVGLSSGLSMGQGDSGCLCGAVGGGALVLGLFLSEEGAYRNGAKVRKAVNQLHDRFKFIHKSTCCRVLTRKVKEDKTAHFDQCAGFTHDATRMVADILFQYRPELIERVAGEFVSGRNSKGSDLVRRILNRLFR